MKQGGRLEEYGALLINDHATEELAKESHKAVAAAVIRRPEGGHRAYRGHLTTSFNACTRPHSIWIAWGAVGEPGCPAGGWIRCRWDTTQQLS